MKFIIYFCIIGLFSCGKKTKDKIEILYPMNESSFQDVFLFSNIIELDKSSGLGSAIKLDLVEEEFYILDEESSRSLQVFSKDGKFIRKIESFETQRIYDFFVSAESGYIFLASQGGRIEILSLDGEYIRTVRLDFNFEKIVSASNTKILLYKGYDSDLEDDHLFAVVDLDSGEIVKELINLDKVPILEFSPNQFYTKLDQGYLLINPPFQPYFLKLSKEFDIQYSYEFDFRDKLISNLQDGYVIDESQGIITYSDGLVFSNDRVFFYFSENGVPNFREFSLNQQQSKKLSIDKSSIDSFLYSFVLLQPTVAQNGKIYGVVDIDYINLYLSQNEADSSSKLSMLRKSESLLAIIEIEVL
jgi:hypothetical protein